MAVDAQCSPSSRRSKARRRAARGGASSRASNSLRGLALALVCMLAACVEREAPLRAPAVDPGSDLAQALAAPSPERRGASPLPVRLAPDSVTQREMREYIEEAYTEGRREDALHVLEALATRPPMSRLRVDAAREWIAHLEDSGRASEADGLREQLRREAPPIAWLQAYDARKLQAAGRVQEAEQAWRSAVRLDRHDLASWLGLADFLVAQGREGDAREVLLGYERAVADLGLRLAQRHPPGEKLVWLAALDVDVTDPRVWHAVSRALDDPHPDVVREALRQLGLRAGPEILPGLRARLGVGVPAELEGDWQRAISAIEGRGGERRPSGRRRGR